MITETSFPNLSDLSIAEKRNLWLKFNGYTLTYLARVLGITPSTLSRRFTCETMPTEQHAKLIALGMPAEYLPRPLNKRPGPRPSSPRELPVSFSA